MSGASKRFGKSRNRSSEGTKTTPPGCKEDREGTGSTADRVDSRATRLFRPSTGETGVMATRRDHRH